MTGEKCIDFVFRIAHFVNICRLLILLPNLRNTLIM